MSRVAFWNPKIAEKEIMGNAMDRLIAAGEAVAEKARSLCKVGTISRPMYSKGRYAGQYWTARDAGALKKTIRVFTKHGGTGRNVWVMAGTKKVYYAQIVEFYTPFLRPALNGSKAKIKRIIQQPTMAGGGSSIAMGGKF